MKRNLLKIYIIFLLFPIFAILTSCDSVDDEMVYLDTTTIEYETYYYEDKKITLIHWDALFENLSDKDVNQAIFYFNFYQDGKLIELNESSYSVRIKNNKSNYHNFEMTAKEKINEIEFVSWEVRFDTIWNSHKQSFIWMIVITILFLIVYGMIVFFKELELDDVIDAVLPKYWILFIVLPIITPIFTSLYKFYIFLMGVGICIIGALIIHFIQDKVNY